MNENEFKIREIRVEELETGRGMEAIVYWKHNLYYVRKCFPHPGVKPCWECGYVVKLRNYDTFESLSAPSSRLIGTYGSLLGDAKAGIDLDRPVTDYRAEEFGKAIDKLLKTNLKVKI